MSASPGSAPMSAESLASTRASRRVRSIVSTRCAVNGRPACQPRAIRGDDDVGDVAVDHIAGVEHDGSDRGALGQPLDRLGVWFVGGEQREFGERGAQQRRRHQRLAELLQYDRGVGELAACAAEFLWHDQCGRADLLAQQLPQRLVVAAFGRHRLHAPPRATRACRPTPRRSRAAVPVLHSSDARLQQSPSRDGAQPGRPTPTAAPALATATAKGRAPA